MSRLSRLLIAVALCAVSMSAHAAALRLVAPSNGETLRGGSFAELRWSAADLPPNAEEWEAFLSVDGGKYYAFRITPHLDVALQRFTFEVPNVTTSDARILIRAGNEKRETSFEPRGSFSIARDPNAEVAVPRLKFGRGEAARAGDREVLSWTDGARNGRGLTQQSTTPVPTSSVEAIIRATHEADAELAPEASDVAAPSITIASRPAAHANARRSEPLPLSVDLLLVCRRRNI